MVDFVRDRPIILNPTLILILYKVRQEREETRRRKEDKQKAGLPDAADQLVYGDTENSLLKIWPHTQKYSFAAHFIRPSSHERRCNL